MALNELGSIASIVSLIIGIITGIGLCKFSIKYNKQINKLFSFLNFGTIKQENKKED